MLAVGASCAFAERIGGSNLPSAKPALKGRIDDSGGPSSAFAIGMAAGATSNAGPTFAEEPSAFAERSFTFAHVRSTGLGRLALSVSLSDRIYADFDPADERSGAATAELAKDWGGQQSILAFSASSGRGVEERLSEVALSFAHAWTDGTVRPYLKTETALLDFHDIPDPVAPFRNQDDRDRVSSRGEIGLRLTLTEHVDLEVGAGVDGKRYLARYDDFGVARDSLTPFGVIGIVRTWERGSLKALYMPFLRTFRDGLFGDVMKHGYAIEGEATLADAVKVLGAARYGFEETDFLIASSAYERVVLGGLVVTLDGGASVSLAASQSRRAYEDLDLVGVARDDRKFEIALVGEMPLLGNLSLSGRVSYLDYSSSLGNVGTDALTVSMGLTYAEAR